MNTRRGRNERNSRRLNPYKWATVIAPDMGSTTHDACVYRPGRNNARIESQTMCRISMRFPFVSFRCVTSPWQKGEGTVRAPCNPAASGWARIWGAPWVLFVAGRNRTPSAQIESPANAVGCCFCSPLPDIWVHRQHVVPVGNNNRRVRGHFLMI